MARPLKLKEQEYLGSSMARLAETRGQIWPQLLDGEGAETKGQRSASAPRWRGWPRHVGGFGLSSSMARALNQRTEECFGASVARLAATLDNRIGHFRMN